MGNYAAITAAVLSAPLTEGGSLVAYSAIASGIVAAADEALKSGRLKLGSSEAYDAQYEDFYQAWEQLYNVAAWTDGGVGVAQLYRSIRAVSIAKSIKRLAAESKLCGRSNSFKALWKGRNVEEAVSKLVDNLDLGASVGKIGDYEVYEKVRCFIGLCLERTMRYSSKQTECQEQEKPRHLLQCHSLKIMKGYLCSLK